MNFREIEFSPYRTNVIDCVGRKDLATQDGRPVTIERSMTEFVIRIGDEIHRTDDNIVASRILNSNTVGTSR